MSTDVVAFDPDIDLDDDDLTPDGPPEPEAQTAEQPDTAAAESQAADGDAAQPHEQEATDPEFAKQDTFKDPTAWESFTNTLAAVLGKTPEEVTALPFAQRMEALEELKGLPERLEKLADFENFTGIVVDKPADQWEVKAQLDELPPNHYNKLVDTVLRDNISNFVKTVAADPAQYADDLPVLQTAAATMMEAVYQRPVAEVDAIVDMTRGIPVAQLQAILQGGQQQTQSYGQQNYQPVGYASQAPPSSQSGLLLQQAQDAYNRAQAMVNTEGYEQDHPQVVYLANHAQQLWQTGQALLAQERQFQQVQSQLQQVQSQYGKAEEQTKEQAQRAAYAEVDGLAEKARNGVLEAVTKGRIPTGKDHVRTWIARDAEADLVANPRAVAALDLARAWRADGQEAKAKQHLAVYTQLADRAYKAAASKVLAELVTSTETLKAADSKKAARKEIAGSTGAATNNSLAPDGFKDLQIGRQDVGELALREYKRRQALQGG